MSHSAKKRFWLALTVLGAVLPGYFTLRFSIEKTAEWGGFTPSVLMNLSPEFYRVALSGNVSTQLLVDIIICTLVFFTWMYSEGKRLQMRNLWLYVLITYMIAFSFAMPMFMFFRERRLESAGVKA